MSEITLVIASVFVLLIIGAFTCIWILKDLLVSVFSLCLISFFASVLFFLLQTPDVALVEIIVGGCLTPAIFFHTLRKIEGRKK